MFCFIQTIASRPCPPDCPPYEESQSATVLRRPRPSHAAAWMWCTPGNCSRLGETVALGEVFEKDPRFLWVFLRGALADLLLIIPVFCWFLRGGLADLLLIIPVFVGSWGGLGNLLVVGWVVGLVLGWKLWWIGKDNTNKHPKQKTKPKKQKKQNPKTKPKKQKPKSKNPRKKNKKPCNAPLWCLEDSQIRWANPACRRDFTLGQGRFIQLYCLFVFWGWGVFLVLGPKQLWFWFCFFFMLSLIQLWVQNNTKISTSETAWWSYLVEGNSKQFGYNKSSGLRTPVGLILRPDSGCWVESEGLRSRNRKTSAVGCQNHSKNAWVV